MARPPVYLRTGDDSSSPARQLRAVVPNSNNDLPDGVTKALYIISDGDLHILADEDTEAVAAFPVAAGLVFPVRTRRVLAGTTATVIALY